MRHRITALSGAVIAGAVLSAVPYAAPASADERGFSVRVSAPGDFTVGRDAETLTAVVTSENRRCRKVRFVLLMRTRIDAGQARVTRVEEAGPFATTDRTEGTTSTFVDNELDPGESCRGRTLTGRWQVAFDGPDGGDVQFEVRAFDEQNTLLTAAGASAEVEGGREAEPEPEPSESESEEAAEPEESEEAAPIVEESEPPLAPSDTDNADAALIANESALLGPGLIIGGICVFLGVMLLLRLRSRSRQTRIAEQSPPTGFYSAPGSYR
ncbi:hypothetical protein [Actinoplanes derwentensis]|uniref:Uncharacterized protein n=1 Tax=Actinoplanes derwentensis TaxID=113562 RepID=A0A1H1PTR3_9ACTN|nr:hypothetical protein [Actinoplanes derwentensis]GID88426.1 hypothetical protein Ade03nite_73500 [Actinoplanes derwentensis]SDS14578.1 hypothetical protein SAMN04489716_0114 [Actinoplanes derwentensis]